MRSLLATERCSLFQGDCAALAEICPPDSIDALITDPPAGIGFMGNKWDRNRGGRDQWITWLADLFRPALCALKPGAHALVWALPRTSHWTAMALELAGFEIRDVHHHIFGTGFPKSLTCASADIPEGTGTALKPAVEHWLLVRKPLSGTVDATFAAYGTGVLNIDVCRVCHASETDRASATPQGRVTSGDHTLPNVANLARKEFERPDTSLGRWPAHLSLEHAETCAPAACVIGCPVRLLDEQSGATKSSPNIRKTKARDNLSKGRETDRTTTGHADAGGASRFFAVFPARDVCQNSFSSVCGAAPASTLIATEPDSVTAESHAPVKSIQPQENASCTGLTDEKQGHTTGVTPTTSRRNDDSVTQSIQSTDEKSSHVSMRTSTSLTDLASAVVQSEPIDITKTTDVRATSSTSVARATSKSTSKSKGPGDPVSASARFMYVAKGSRKEKDAGLDHLVPKTGGEATGRVDDSAGTQNPRAGAGRTGGARNFHPTVKSIALMRWLVRLITPPGGTVLDIFAGSGSTGVAALAEGCRFVGIEQGGDADEYIPILEGRIRGALAA